MLKILIVEDSPIYVALLKNKLSLLNIPLQIIGDAPSCSKAIEIIALQKPDVIILDVNLENGTGFDLFKEINYKDYQIIFASAHENYAINAFEVEAIGYLLKPVEKVQLEKYLLIAQKNIKASQAAQLINVKESVLQYNITSSTITVPSEAGFDILPIPHIIRCEAINSTTHLFLINNKKLVSSYNLGKFFDQLQGKGFFQVHRSHIISLVHVKKYLRSGIVIMSDGAEIPLSKINRNEFISLFSVIDK